MINQNDRSSIESLFITVFTWEPHLDTSIELSVLLKKASVNVHYCFIWVHNIEEGSGFKHFLFKIYALLRLVRLLIKYKVNYSLHFVWPALFNFQFKIKSLSQLEVIRWKEKPIGLGIMSTLNDLYTDKIIDSDQAIRYAPISLYRAACVYDIAEKVIDFFQPSSLYLFNQRFSNTRPLYLAAQGLVENIYTYEGASASDKYSLIKGSIFDGSLRSKIIREHWNQGAPNRIEVANSFFSDLKVTASNYFLPSISNWNPCIDDSKINILFCPSSIHETYALDSLYPTFLFSSQDVALRYLIKICSDSARYNLIIRVHPITASKSREEINYWSSFSAYSNIQVIPFDSEVSSYNLMRMVDCLIVYHSTIAIEAAFEGIPSMALGNPWYIDLNCVFKPHSFSDIGRFMNLDTDIMSRLEYSNSLFYGYYQKTYGEVYRHINPTFS